MKLLRSMLGGVATVGTIVALAVPVSASPVTGTTGAVVGTVHDGLSGYWTADKMRSAQPSGQIVDQSASSSSTSSTATARSTTPQKRMGKVFFTLHGKDYVCSGTATKSNNGDVVTTAGHCVNDGKGTFASNFVFVPAYDDGKAPYGVWSAKRLFTSKAWSSSHNNNYDVGFAVVNANKDFGGHSLSYVTGTYPIAFNQSRGEGYRSYGYPAMSPYNGKSLRTCTSTATPSTHAGQTTQAMHCGMTEGSSGGGWISNGVLNSVNSYKYDSDPNTMYGPYFGSSIKAIYTTASNF